MLNKLTFKLSLYCGDNYTTLNRRKNCRQARSMYNLLLRYAVTLNTQPRSTSSNRLHCALLEVQGFLPVSSQKVDYSPVTH